jgi:hypothetical protein
MRGDESIPEDMFSYIRPEQRVPADHPLRPIRTLVDEVLAQAFFTAVVKQAQARQLLSSEHFTVDGTLIEAWAGLKSFTRRDTVPPTSDDPGNPTVDFHGERRSNATHGSTTDPEARLMRKGRGR